MQRRSFLELASTAAFAQLATGCDQLVVVEPRQNPQIPGVTPVGDFYVYSYAPQPEYDAETHEMIVADIDGTELARFGRTFLNTLEPVETEQTLQCIGSSPRVQRISNAVWSGLTLLEVFDALGVVVPKDAVGLRMTGMDRYTAGIPIDDLTDAPVWMMWGMNGEELSFDHGAPARLLVPGKYGMKALKWIQELAFVTEPHESYWTRFGWSEEAPYLPNTLIASPLDGVTVGGDQPVRFVGTAFAGEDPVVAVEVRIDSGAWLPVELDYAPGAGIWAVWSFVWDPEPGRHTFQFRAITESGAISSENPRGDDQFLGYNGSMQVVVST